MQRAAAAERFSCSAEVVQKWPGGRHANDSEDFRGIQVVPTPDEVAPGVCEPFLPQADGSDQFLGWQVQLFLDCENVLTGVLPFLRYSILGLNPTCYTGRCISP